jgi:hypothetical protein
VSEQAPERPPAGGPPKKENVFTRKIGPLPMWVWLAIAAAVLLVVVFMMKKKKGGSGQGQGQGQQGFGRGLVPPIIIERLGGPPHIRHHHRRGDHDDDDDDDGKRRRHRKGVDPGGPNQRPSDQAIAAEHDRQRAARDPGAGDVPGHNRRDMRGEPVPGMLVNFKTAEKGQTPSLLDVANHYDTSPEAIVQEATGRGYPNSVPWKRYVARHDWGSPLPPATEFSILAHPER